MFTQSFLSFLATKNILQDEIAKYLEKGTKIGKILKRYKLSDQDVHFGVIAFEAKSFASKIILSSDKMLISTAYQQIHSCMTDYAKEVAEFYAYTAPTIQVALYMRGETIIGRCVVNTSTMKRSEIYAPIEVYEKEFSVGLEELGYWFDEDTDVMRGATLPLAEWYPYIDGQKIQIIRVGSVVRVFSGNLHIQSTNSEIEWMLEDLDFDLDADYYTYSYQKKEWFPLAKVLRNPKLLHSFTWTITWCNSPHGMVYRINDVTNGLYNIHMVQDNYGELINIEDQIPIKDIQTKVYCWKSPTESWLNIHSSEWK